MISHLLIDQDGILADFPSAVARLFAVVPDFFPPKQWALWESLDVSQDEFWARIAADTGFWERIPPFSWTGRLVALFDRLRRERGILWTVATSPARDPSCSAQKIRWMRKHIRKDFGNYMIGGRKTLMARPDCLLIDDSQTNCIDFLNAGGLAMLFPARANGFEVPDPAAWLETNLIEAIRSPSSITAAHTELQRITTPQQALADRADVNGERFTTERAGCD